MVMPFVIGDFFPGHSEEVAGGKYFALVQFAGQKDGATRCAKIVKLLLAIHIDLDVSDPPEVVAVLLEVSNTFCSVSRQPQLDVLPGKASGPYDDGRVRVGNSLDRIP